MKHLFMKYLLMKYLFMMYIFLYCTALPIMGVVHTEGRIPVNIEKNVVSSIIICIMIDDELCLSGNNNLTGEDSPVHEGAWRFLSLFDVKIHVSIQMVENSYIGETLEIPFGTNERSQRPIDKYRFISYGWYK